ncbi:hypothetical protein Taro_007850 [Colocasia esculenta]|uniref:Uncharacterized protein n=1 Tax=Colocasia esculenta TaxID=4460 RepID=A0A843TWK4_COLES|nr:hypothetical protein [Colocasia esculenta]
MHVERREGATWRRPRQAGRAAGGGGATCGGDAGHGLAGRASEQLGGAHRWGARACRAWARAVLLCGRGRGAVRGRQVQRAGTASLGCALLLFLLLLYREKETAGAREKEKKREIEEGRKGYCAQEREREKWEKNHSKRERGEVCAKHRPELQKKGKCEDPGHEENL